MKHIEEHNNHDGSYSLECKACQDTLTLQYGDWPYWMKLALKNGFADIHSTCPATTEHPKAVSESLTCTRRA